MELRDSSVNVVSTSNFSIIFCYHIKSFLIISNFLKIDKVTVSNWYQNLDNKLIRKCVRSKMNILYMLVIAKNFILKVSNRQKSLRENITKRWWELLIMIMHSCIEI